MMKRTVQEQVERAAWWRRRPWPCVVLGVDPGAEAGTALLVPHRQSTRADTPEAEGGFQVLWAREVGTMSRQLEATIQEAAVEARARGLHLVVSLEDWGRGGKLGIKTWLGLGAAAGAWKRATLLAAAEDCGDVLTVSRSILQVQQATWRSWMVEESGDRSTGRFVPFDSEGWKRAATRACAAHFPYLQLEGANAAEAALLAAYTLRSDELGRLLPATYLKRHGFEPPLIEEVEPRRGKRRGSPGQ